MKLACPLAFLCSMAAVTPALATIDTLWNFNGDLSADYGTATLSWRGDTGSVSQFYTSEHQLGLPMPFGDNAGLLYIPATTPTQGLYVDFNNGGQAVTEYSITWDIFRPSESWGKWTPLLQTSLSNNNDGDFFINTSGGIGIGGNYSGKVTNGKGAAGTTYSQAPTISWNRVTMTYANGTISKYIDGNLVGTQTGQSAAKYTLDTGFLTFADDNNESSAIYISSLRFQDKVMSASEIQALGTVHAGGAATAGVQMADNPANFKAGSFTIAVLGDTQIYSRNQAGTDILKQSTQWLLDNKDARNIKHVIQVGDISDDSSVGQFTNTRTAMDTLNGEISYSVVRGNHDIYNNTNYDRADTFGPNSAYGQQTGLVRYVGSGGEAQSTRNTYQTFEANGIKFLVLNLDLVAKTEVVDWANQVVSTHHDHRVIINTHAYMTDGGERFNGTIDSNSGKSYDELRASDLVGHNESVYNGSKYGGQDAEVLWNKLVSQHENIFLVLSGHQFENFDQFKYKLDEGVNGNLVYQILVNQQDMALGGSGWIRLLEFDPDNETVRVKTYSPYLDAWDTSADVYYNIGMSAVPEPSTYALIGAAAAIGLAVIRRRKSK